MTSTCSTSSPIPMKWGWVDVDDVVETLANRPGRQYVVITGRSADPAPRRDRRPGHRDAARQAPVRQRPEGSAGHRMVGTDHLAAVSLPRLIVAAPASGHGKTTVATGLMAALPAPATTCRGHKVGPDYIDPGYHALATGKPGRNLDPHLVGEERLVPLLLHGARGADLAIIEGVMGLYDGQIGGEGFASTAHVATVTRTPGGPRRRHLARLPLDRRAGARAWSTFDPSVRIVGVILNKAGSPRHAGEVVSALESTGLPVLGVLQRDDGIVAPSRHLGLVPAAERDDAATRSTGSPPQIAEHDRPRPAARARALGARPGRGAVGRRRDRGRPPGRRDRPGRGHGRRARLHVPLRRDRGAAPRSRLRRRDVRPARPTRRCRTGTAGLYLGGGFPEVHAAGLSANAPLARGSARGRRLAACRRTPSAPACSISAAPSTACRWSARSPPRRS